MSEDKFLEESYEVPKEPSRYMNGFEDGDNKVRILTQPKFCWEYFNTESKPVRSSEKPSETPQDIGSGKYGQNKVYHVWAMKAYNFSTGLICLFSIKQSSIQEAIVEYFKDEDWGDPRNYNLTITKKEENGFTKYYVKASPHTELTEEIKKQVESIGVDVEAWLRGEKEIFSEKKLVAKPAPQTNEKDHIGEGMKEEVVESYGATSYEETA